LADDEARGGGGGGGVQDVDGAGSADDAEVVDQLTARLDGLGADAGAASADVGGPDLGDQTAEGGHERALAEGARDFVDAGPPVAARHAPEAGIGGDGECVPGREAPWPISLAAEREHGVR